MRKCEHCGSEGRIMVQMTVVAPGSMYMNLPKRNFRYKEVEVWGVLWETADFICGSPACGRTSDGYGNYVTRLKKTCEDLKAENANLRALIERKKNAQQI